MGRATKWLKGLLGIKTNKERNINEYSVSMMNRRNDVVSCHNPPPNISPADAAWLRAFYSEPDSEQKQRARAVAAATAAAADAAMAAAQAASAVVRLSSRGPGTAVFGGGREIWASVKIQAVFRGFLARKALRALKGLVKIQALVRGFLVRKQADAALHSMQALIRAQASVRAQRARLLNISDEIYPPQFQARKSLDNKYDEYTSSLDSRKLSAPLEAATNICEESPKIVEVDTWCRPKSRPGSPNLAYEECYFPSAQNTPRFAGSRAAMPVKSLGSYREHRNYMAKTESSKAKVRSQSAPRQRTEPEAGPKRMIDSRNREAINFKSAIMRKLGS